MNDRPPPSAVQPSGDVRLHAAATREFDGHVRSVGAEETEAALAAVRERISDGDDRVLSMTTAGGGASPRRTWLLVAASVSVLALVAGLLVTALGGDGGDVVVPATDPATVPTIAATTTIPATPVTTVAPPDGAVPVVTEPPQSFVPQTITVDANNPPAVLDPVVLASVPLEANPDGRAIDYAVLPEGILIKQPASRSLTVVGTEPGQVTTVALDADVASIVGGPGSVVYGLGGPVFDAADDVAPRGIEVVAIPIVGDRAGQVVATAEVGLNDYLELPPYFFGHGSDGIIDRGRQVGRTIIDYVDETGEPLAAAEEFTVPVAADVDADGNTDRVSVQGSVVAWNLDIGRDPTSRSSFVGTSPAAPMSGDRVMYAERIGPDTTPEADFGTNSMPVVAILNPDGSGSWVRLPDDWDVVASDVWGTAIARVAGDVIEVGYLDAALRPAAQSGDPLPVGVPLAIPDRCGTLDFDCTQLASTEDGSIVAYDPSDDTLRTYDASGMTQLSAVALDEPLTEQFPYLVHIGPDDVAYLTVDTPGLDDPSNDLLAIPLVGPNAGEVVMRWTDLDGSGDSSLIARKAGLVSVPCCGGTGSRPADDAPIFRFVDRNGELIESTAPTFRVDLGEAGNNLVRINTDGTSTFFALPTVFAAPRDIPRFAATDDGGALGMDFVFVGDRQQTVIVDFDTDWPEFGIDNSDVWYVDELGGRGPVLLEASGTVVLRDDAGGFVRATLDEVADSGWPGRVATDVESGVTTAPGLNEFIAANQPSWAADPGAFALQVESSVGPNERVSIDTTIDGQITVTTSGLLDDSTASVVRVITVERAADNLLRFVTSTYGWTCQPGRGHQDVSTEACR